MTATPATAPTKTQRLPAVQMTLTIGLVYPASPSADLWPMKQDVQKQKAVPTAARERVFAATIPNRKKLRASQIHR
ncbi:MAG: hypothetical protein SO314_07705 [Alphaproteobacteria bacterium]|nr:hypothetical protein [Alphaproteobacteria bacterium]